MVSSTQVRGSVTSGRFCDSDASFTTYFDVVFDRAFTSTAVTGGFALTWNTTSNRVVTAKVGVSFVSTANAAANRAAENPGWDFAAVAAAAKAAWNALLGKVQVTGGSADQQTIFYLGSMSAWYVFSALGFYPQTPGTADLVLGSPVFTRATIALGGGGTITINAPAATDGAPYVQSLSLDGAA